MRLWPLLALTCLVAARGAAQETRLVLLGTGNPNPDPDRSGPAVAVVAGGQVYLFDAGPGVVRRAEAARRAGVAELTQPNLRVVFLTHLHSDHTLGLPDLMLSPWVIRRTAPLQVYGPPGTRSMVEHLLAAYRVDIEHRLNGWEPANTTGWRAQAHEIRPGLVYRDSLVRVIAFRVPHGDWDEAYGYRIEAPGRTIVISGDTRPSDAVVDACRRCDILVHEAYSDSAFARLPPEWRRYHGYFHTSAAALAALAERAQPGLLVLYHQLSWGLPIDSVAAEVRRRYHGRVESGHDLDVF